MTPMATSRLRILLVDDHEVVRDGVRSLINANDDMTVVAVTRQLKPWRLAASRRAKAVLELAAGECERLGIGPGERLAWGRISS